MKDLLKFVLVVAAILAVAAGVMLKFFVTVLIVGDDSMAPTMIADEQVLMWRGAEPELGDIVLCEHPGDPNVTVIGRVFATTGMSVKLGRGAILVNNRRLDRNWLGTFEFEDANSPEPVNVKWGVEIISEDEHEFMQRAEYVVNVAEQTVPGGRIFLMSDYRSMDGYDSRTFGPVVAAKCQGQIFMRLKPIEGFDETAPLDHSFLDFLD